MFILLDGSLTTLMKLVVSSQLALHVTERRIAWDAIRQYLPMKRIGIGKLLTRINKFAPNAMLFNL